MSKRAVTYDAQEFKESSVKLAVESDQSISQTAKNLGIHVITLHGCAATNEVGCWAVDQSRTVPN